MDTGIRWFLTTRHRKCHNPSSSTRARTNRRTAAVRLLGQGRIAARSLCSLLHCPSAGRHLLRRHLSRQARSHGQVKMATTLTLARNNVSSVRKSRPKITSVRRASRPGCPGAVVCFVNRRCPRNTRPRRIMHTSIPHRQLGTTTRPRHSLQIPRISHLHHQTTHAEGLDAA